VSEPRNPSLSSTTRTRKRSDRGRVPALMAERVLPPAGLRYPADVGFERGTAL
jgi:hypothetical protein